MRAGSSTIFRSGGDSGIGTGYETSGEAREEIHAGEPGPGAVRLEERVGLLGLDPAAPERGRQLDEPEVSPQAAVVAAEAFEAHDPDRPRTEPSLALEPGDDGTRRQLAEALEIERSAQPDQRRGAARTEPEPAQLRRREPTELGARRRCVQLAKLRRGRPDHRSLDLPRVARLDQLAGDRAKQGLGDGAGSHRPEAAQLADRLSEQRVPRDFVQELRMVVLEAEGEADPLDPGLHLGRSDDHAVGPLRRLDALEPAVDADGLAVDPVVDAPARVAGVLPGEPERVRPYRAQVGANHPPSVEVPSDARPGCLAGLAAQPRAEAPAVPRPLPAGA